VSYIKNQAVTGFSFGLVNKDTGEAVTTGSVTGYVTLDGGTQAVLSDTAVHEGNGQWSINLTAAEMNGDVVGVLFTHTDAIPVQFTIKTVEAGAGLTGTVTIISSWGGGTSNCYLAYTAANSWITTSIRDYSAWTNASVYEREAALLTATRDVDSQRYIYTRYYTNQLLEFPRAITAEWANANVAWDAQNLSSYQTRMQLDVEQATCLQAVHILQQAAMSSHTDLALAGITEMRREAGPIKESYKYGAQSKSSRAPGGSRNRLCPEALQLLADWRRDPRIFRA
jgi:hypothetical protein